jgi:hypothetical protein
LHIRIADRNVAMNSAGAAEACGDERISRGRATPVSPIAAHRRANKIRDAADFDLRFV